MLKFFLAAAATAAAVAAPAEAQNTGRAPFNGFRLEGVVGTDRDVFYGGAIGYDLQRGRLVLGIENELDLSSASHCTTFDASIMDRLCERNKRDIYVGGRIGIAVLPRTLLYAKVGYTNFHVGYIYDDGSGPVVGSFKFVDKLDGVRLGGGIEQRIGRSVYIKGEYRYSSYEFGASKHDGVVGIGIRF
jgi:outer membrane immunogenic protein